MIQLNLKPLSVNEAWQGKRFKTTKYAQYERAALFLLPPLKLPEPPYKISFEFGFSNTQSDIDNPTKSFLDILSKKYSFNDKLVYEINIKKSLVKKGQEFLRFNIESFVI